jgi:magnesium-transporting ATPase (P-type)
MITGDHGATAQAIAAQLGIGGNRRVLAGPELEALDDAALRSVVLDTDVYARASPEHKLRLVAALQDNRQVVAMTGDGVNDAPALKRADVGVAMGMKGTEAAKEAAEMVLADDNFASITHAVEEGRTVYDNLRKALLFTLPTNGAEALVIIAAILFGTALPLTPVQVLWVNMVTAVTLSLSLAFEPAEANVMRRRPRDPSEPLVNGFMLWRIALVSVLLVIAPLSLFLWQTAQGVSHEAARTVAVNALVMGEICYLFNSRFMFDSSLSRRGLLGSRAVLLTVGILLALQLAFTYFPPVQRLLGTAPIGAADWGIVTLAGLAVFLLVELEKSGPGSLLWSRQRQSHSQTSLCHPRRHRLPPPHATRSWSRRSDRPMWQSISVCRRRDLRPHKRRASRLTSSTGWTYRAGSRKSCCSRRLVYRSAPRAGSVRHWR